MLFKGHTNTVLTALSLMDKNKFKKEKRKQNLILHLSLEIAYKLSGNLR